AVLRRLERAGHVEDLLALLDREHAARGEAMPVARALDLVEHRARRIAWADEIGLQRVADAVLDRLVGGRERLGDDLAAENAGAVFRRGKAAEEVFFDRLQRERRDESVHRGHMKRPWRFGEGPRIWRTRPAHK